MKKIMMMILCLTMMGCACPCKLRADENRGRFVGMANPWIGCGTDVACGAQKAGFDFPLNVQNYDIRAMHGMFEIQFPLNGKTVTARKTLPKEKGVDISGDYNKYPVDEIITLSTGEVCHVRGHQDSYIVANFTKSTGEYSFRCPDGLTLAEVESLAKLLADTNAK